MAVIILFQAHIMAHMLLSQELGQLKIYVPDINSNGEKITKNVIIGRFFAIQLHDQVLFEHWLSTYKIYNYMSQ